MVIVSLVAFIFVIGIIILVHEAGHFFTARKAGIKCNEFSIGMGPVIKQWKSKETTISLRWIPLGGYVSMVDGNESDLYIDKNKELGLNLENGCVKEIVCNSTMDADVKGIVKRVELKSKHGEPLEIDLEIDGEIKTFPVLANACYVLDKSTKQELVPYNQSFDSKKCWQRLIVLFAGAFMNFVLGIILCIIASFIQGTANTNSSVIGEVSEGYALANAKVQAGDQITEVTINGTSYSVSSWNEFSDVISENYTTHVYPMTLTYVRDGNTYKAENLDPYIYIVKAGLTNYEAEKYKNESGEEGVIVGSVDSNYGDSFGEGDIITSIKVAVYDNNAKVYDPTAKFEPVSSWDDILTYTLGSNYNNSLNTCNDNEQITIKYLDRIEKDGVVTYEEKTTNVYTAYSNEVLDAQGYSAVRFIFGASPTTHREFSSCMKQAFSQFWSYFTQVVKTLKSLLFPSNGVRTIGAKNLSSVVGIYSMVSQYLALGAATFLFFVAMLSINIGIMNLLPVPALDGGRIIFVLYEMITGRKANKKFETILNFIFYILLFALFIFITYNDILRLAK